MAKGGVGRPGGGRSDVIGLRGSGRTNDGGVTCVPVGGRCVCGRPGVPGPDGSATTGVGVPEEAGDWPGTGGLGRDVVPETGGGGLG